MSSVSSADEVEKKQSGLAEEQSAEETSEIGIRINARAVKETKKEKSQSPSAEGDVAYEEELIEELGKKYHVPYRIVKEAEIAVAREQLKSFSDATKLQYDLMTLDPVLKASVNYGKARITIIYNPKGARNLRPKTDLQELLAFLGQRGIQPSSVQERDYDYYKEFYSYAFNPPRIRTRPPYGYDPKKWEKIKEEYEKERLKREEEKRQKFRQWQAAYLERHRDVLSKYPQDLARRHA